MITAGIITRFHYAENDPRFLWRFNYFQNTVLPRILKQDTKGFDLCIRCEPHHDDLFLSLENMCYNEGVPLKVFKVKNERARYRQINKKKYFLDFVLWKDVIGLPTYDLQSGLDSDDLIGPEYMTKVFDTVYSYKDQSLHLSFQPKILDIKTQRERSIRVKYHPKKGSAFLSLYQPDKTNYKFIYECSHLTMWRNAKTSLTLPVGYCWASVHGYNESTGV